MLVIRGGAIGDFILTLPVLSALREAFPETHLEVLGYPRLAELAMSAGIIDGFRSIEARALAGFFARNGTLDPELAEYFKSFSIIFSYLYDPDSIFRINVARCSKAQYYEGPHRPNELEETHATTVFLKPLEKLAIFEADPVPKLGLKPAPADAESLPGKWLALHPGSGSEKKNWPEDRWAALIERLLRETAWNLLLVGGEAEGDRLQRLAQSVPDNRRFILQNVPLVRLAARLAKTSVFMGHDSGISHLGDMCRMFMNYDIRRL